MLTKGTAMSNIPFKAIAVDMDGTFMNSEINTTMPHFVKF